MLNGDKPMKKIIAVDFDGCLCESKWPNIGEAHQHVINELIREQAHGAKLILWTCREGQLLQAAVMWCLNRGLKFDAINDNLPEMKDMYGNNCRKVSATEYWDDKSVIVSMGESGEMMVKPRIIGGVVLKQWRREIVKVVEMPEMAEMTWPKEEAEPQNVENAPAERERHRRAGRKPQKRRWWQWFVGLRRDSDPSSRDSDPPSAT